MNQDLIRAVTPLLIIILWLNFCRYKKNRQIGGVALFFASVAAFSQNFFSFFRELHQIIQIVLALAALPTMAIKSKSFNKIFIGLSVFVTLSIFNSRLDVDAQSQLVNLTAVILVTNYLFRRIRSHQDLDSILRFIGYISIALSITGIIERLTGVNDRIEASFSNPNYLGLYLGIGFCCIHQKFRDVRRLIGLSIVLVALVLTGSRSALLIPVMCILWNSFRTHGIRGLLLYSLLSCTALGILFASGSSRLSDVEAGQASDAERIIFAGIAVNMAKNHPLTGVGWGRFIAEFGNYSSAADQIILESGVIDASSQDRRVTHNDLIRVLSELGFIAFFCAIAIIAVGTKIVYQIKQKQLLFLLPTWIGIILFSLTHNNLNTAFFWFFFLLPFSIDQCVQRPSDQLESHA